MILSQQETKKEHIYNRQRITSLFADVKSLFKAMVLISNVLPVLTGFWLALYFTNTAFIDVWAIALLTITGSTMVMAGALLFNNWYDSDIDSVMERTKDRPTVTGRISRSTVLNMGIFFSIIGFAFLLFTSVEVVVYAFVGWFTYVVLYTVWSKRRYTSSTIFGSVSGAVTPLIGWAAIDSALHTVPIVLFLILFIWQMPHTYAIAMKRHDEYSAANVPLLPVVRGFATTKRHMFFYICCLFPLPFYLSSLGTSFLLFALILNLGWLVISLGGFFTNKDSKWAELNFIYSVNYITLLFFMMMFATLL